MQASLVVHRETPIAALPAAVLALLTEEPDGTLLRMTHTGLPDAEQCAGHAEGWTHDVGRLAECAAGRHPGPAPWHGRTGQASVRAPRCG
ncbi:MAG: SRPBCC domain-containing protein [Alphaproteobacteria bacterium]